MSITTTSRFLLTADKLPSGYTLPAATVVDRTAAEVIRIDIVKDVDPSGIAHASDQATGLAALAADLNSTLAGELDTAHGMDATDTIVSDFDISSAQMVNVRTGELSSDPFLTADQRIRVTGVLYAEKTA